MRDAAALVMRLAVMSYDCAPKHRATFGMTRRCARQRQISAIKFGPLDRMGTRGRKQPSSENAGNLESLIHNI